jgi:nucleoside 2-deoxyribosyltransferase
MITFAPKPNAAPATEATEENRFDRIRRLAAEKHRKADAVIACEDPQKAGDKRPM